MRSAACASVYTPRARGEQISGRVRRSNRLRRIFGLLGGFLEEFRKREETLKQVVDNHFSTV